ncbi:endoplasmic reticulum resident protein 27 [Alosa sapidissima]|uniref:endoplasmic reticulum resident protein 27 n=1 Tax=Alosa sapidissima TaxID=34773 RepID=UPI001C09080D|nr:endoplasmic reticulum resident protein 27 [Alosa sapidissima]
MKTLLVVVFSLLTVCILADVTDEEASLDDALPRLTDVEAVEAFLDSDDVAVIGFFEGKESYGYKEFLEAAKAVKPIPVALCSDKEVWANYSIATDTISIFRKADVGQENLQLSDAKKVDADGLTRFIKMNNVRYITEYNQVTAVGLFQSRVKTHILLFANRGSADYSKLQKRLGAVAPDFSGKFLFVLVNGAVKGNERSLGYFGLTSRDLPRLGLYDSDLDKKWLMPKGDITKDAVRAFCQSFLDGELQETKEAGQPEAKTEL